MTENQEKPVLSLGESFEVIEDTPPAAPAAAPAAATPTGASTDPPFGPIRSANAWGSMGLVIAVAGLLGPWESTGGGFLHGLLLACSVWFLVRGGFLAVQRTGATMPIALPAALVVYGALRIALPGELLPLGWLDASDAGALGVSGAMLTVFGGLVAILMPRTVAKKKDSKLPPAGAPLQLDKQFSLSLLAYLMVFFGMLMNWTDQSVGTDSLGGVLTLLLAMLMVWASWVAMWQLWQKPLVLGKLGILLILAPFEALAMGMVGVSRAVAKYDPLKDAAGNGPNFVQRAYPASDGFEPNLLAYGGGPLLIILASCYALYLIGVGTKEAQKLVKERKAQEVEARKAARAQKKGDSEPSAKDGKSGAKKK